MEADSRAALDELAEQWSKLVDAFCSVGEDGVLTIQTVLDSVSTPLKKTREQLRAVQELKDVKEQL